MPKKRKSPSEWTTDEAMRKLFPKKAVEHLKNIANKKEPKVLEKPKRAGHKPNLAGN